MNKLYRSLLWTGLAAAGLAGCGDDVTVTQPPAAPPPAIRSVTVAPDNITVAPGASITMQAAVVADAGATVAVAWSVNVDASVATIDAASGVLTVAAAAPDGPIVVTATATASPGGATGKGVATLNVQGAKITGITVTPTSATLPADPNGKITATATVQGTGSFDNSVDWSLASQGIVTLSANTGTSIQIIPVAGASGTTQVIAASHADPTKTATISIQVIPATVTIQSVTFGNLATPVHLDSVAGQIEISLNVDAGAAPNVCKVQAVIGANVVAEQSFGGCAGAAAAKGSAKAQAAPQTIVQSVNTREVRKANGLFVPVVGNGNNFISARIFLSSTGTPIVSNAIPVRMWNDDAVMQPDNHVPSNPSSKLTLGSPPASIAGDWYTGNTEVDNINFVAFSKQAPDGVGLDSDCSSSTSTVSGTWDTGMSSNEVFDCSTFEGANTVFDGPFVSYTTNPTGPDATTPIAPNGFSAVSSKFTVDGDDRWNLVAGDVLPGEPVAPALLKGKNTKLAAAVGKVNIRSSVKGSKAAIAALQATKHKVRASSKVLHKAIGTGKVITLPTVLVDNVGPTIAPDEIGFVAACSTAPGFPVPGCWVNGSYNIDNDFPAFDGGTGVASVHVFDLASSVPVGCGNTSYDNIANLAEDPSSSKYNACGRATDNIGNVSADYAGANVFGVDKTAPTITYAGTYPVAGDSVVKNAIPAQTIDYSVNDNNAGLDNTALTLTLTTLIADAAPACASGAIPATLAPAPANTARTMLTPIPSPDNACGDQGYYTWTAVVTDRAGNTATPAAPNDPVVFALDRTAPAIQAVAPKPLYAAGQDATILVFATDSTDLAGARLEAYYTATGGTAVHLGYNVTSGFGTVWDNVLTTVTTPATGFPAVIPGSQVFGSFVIDTTVTLLGLPGAFTQVDVSAFDFFPNFSGVSALPIPDAYKDPTKFPVAGAANPWATTGIVSPPAAGAGFSTSGACTYIYDTPSNAPTIPTQVLVANEVSAGPPIVLDILSSIVTSGTGLNPGDNPLIISDNGGIRRYQYSISATDCATLQGAGTLRLIAIKNDSSNLPSAYLVP